MPLVTIHEKYQSEEYIDLYAASLILKSKRALPKKKTDIAPDENCSI